MLAIIKYPNMSSHFCKIFSEDNKIYYISQVKHLGKTKWQSRTMAGGGARVALVPPDFADIEKRTEGQMEDLLLYSLE